MKKKVLASLLVAAMTASMFAGCGDKKEENKGQSNTPATEKSGGDAPAATEVDYGSGEVKIWVADLAVDFTQEKANQFIKDTGADYKVTVEAVGEADAAGNMITDVAGGADIYGFAQDQIARLVSAGALQQLTGTGYDETIKADNDEGSIIAATVGDNLYAFPLTSDNGYFLYYDKSVVKDPSTLEGIIADCEAAGKNFYCEINSGYYAPAFFFGAGCTLAYETDNEGKFVDSTIDYASDKGVIAAKKMIELASSSSFQNGSTTDKTKKAAAIISGTWDASAAQETFKDNYACAKLPTFKGADGTDYQMGGFSGYKLLGVKPQTEAGKMKLCLDLAQYLSSEEVQLDRYNAVGWGPSNKAAQENDTVKSNEALTAYKEQCQYTIPQGQYPADYWTLATSFGDDIISGKLTTSSSDEDIMAALQTFQDTCKGYAGK